MKKLVLSLAFILFAAITLAQNSVEHMVMADINYYREQYGKLPIFWHERMYEAATHHTEYEYLLNKAEIEKAIEKNKVMDKYSTGHDEKEPVDGLDNLNFTDRALKFGFRAENVYMFCGTMVNDDQVICYNLIKAWKNSPAHNKMMLDGSLKNGAVCVKIVPITDKIVYFSATLNCK